MHFISTVVSVGSLVTVATALTKLESLDIRQTSGPLYQCHYNCGYTIEDATGGTAYCKDSTWLGLLSACLDCALTQDIWNDYGSGVTAAAKACGLDATPKPAGGATSGSAAPTSAAPATTGAPTSAAPTSAAAVTSGAVSSVAVSSVATVVTVPTTIATQVSTVTSSAVVAPTSAAVIVGQTSSASPVPSGAARSSTGTNSTAVPTTAPVNGASNWRSDVAVAGVAAVLAVALM